PFKASAACYSSTSRTTTTATPSRRPSWTICYPPRPRCPRSNSGTSRRPAPARAATREWARAARSVPRRPSSTRSPTRSRRSGSRSPGCRSARRRSWRSSTAEHSRGAHRVELTNEFSVSAPVEETWAVLTDLVRIAPCLPGFELQEVDGDEYRGLVKVKVGPMTAQYKGVASFQERDEANHRAVVRAEGRDTRGQGNA